MSLKGKDTYRVRYKYAGKRYDFKKTGAGFASKALAWLKRGAITELRIDKNTPR